jgi:hypothetical protein
MRRPIVALASLVLLLSIPAVARAGDVFDGAWKITVTPTDENPGPREKEFEDVVTFGGMKFTSKTFAAKGFKPVEYEADTRRGPVAKFVAKPESEKQGTMEWGGTATGVDMQGEMAWTKADGTVLRYTFKGEKQQK